MLSRKRVNNCHSLRYAGLSFQEISLKTGPLQRNGPLTLAQVACKNGKGRGSGGPGHSPDFYM